MVSGAVGPQSRADVALGVLWGTALGDALGLPFEGMSSRAIRRRQGRLQRTRLLFGRAIVSDDTEQSALLAQSLIASADLEACRRRFRRALLGWFLRAPFGIGLGTLRACLRIAAGRRESGVPSAGNGAAMRAGILGAAFLEDPKAREEYGRALAEVTHRDPRAVAGALFVAELVARCGLAQPDVSRLALADAALQTVEEPRLREALRQAHALALREAASIDAARTLGVTGYVLHSVPFATFCFARFGHAPLAALAETISAGGDTDTNAAIVGAFVGALHGPRSLPQELLREIHDGPFGPTHLRELADALNGPRPRVPPRYSALLALLRNLLLIPLILLHGVRRLF